MAGEGPRRDGIKMARARARALHGAGWISMFQGDYEAAKALIEEGLALYRRLGDRDGVAFCLATLGFTATLGQRDLDSVPALFEEATRLKPELTDPRAVAYLFLFFGLIAASEGDPERAVALHEESLALCREINDLQGVSMCLTNWGLMEMARANHARAAELLRENLRLAHGSAHRLAIHWSLVGLAGVALGLENPARAARLWGAAEALREVYGIYFTPLARVHTNYEGLLTTARARLGDADFERAWAVGKATTQDRAVQYALAEGEPSREGEAATREDALTRREEEVAGLVAGGLTNCQIAEELSISGRTADTHVARILKKLNLRSRAQIATRVNTRRSHGEGRVAR